MRAIYAISIPASKGQYNAGKTTNPKVFARGDTVNQAAIATITREVVIKDLLAQLSMNGILFVRMTWMINVCVKIDSTNQPVWKRDGLFAQWNTNHMMKNVI